MSLASASPACSGVRRLAVMAATDAWDSRRRPLCSPPASSIREKASRSSTVAVRPESPSGNCGCVAYRLGGRGAGGVGPGLPRLTHQGQAPDTLQPLVHAEGLGRVGHAEATDTQLGDGLV